MATFAVPVHKAVEGSQLIAMEFSANAPIVTADGDAESVPVRVWDPSLFIVEVIAPVTDVSCPPKKLICWFGAAADGGSVTDLAYAGIEDPSMLIATTLKV